MGSRSHICIGSQVGQELPDFGGSHLLGVALVVEEDEPADPLEIRFFRPQAVVEEAEGVADLIQEPWRRAGSGRRTGFHTPESVLEAKTAGK